MARVKIKHSARASNSALLSGTRRRKTGKSPFPSVAAGPIRVKAQRAGVG